MGDSEGTTSESGEPKMSTYIIAEAAACHDGDLAKALRLIDLAANIGASACKFQWLSRAERLCERRNAPEYLDAYRLLQFPEAWFPDLLSRCEEHGIELMTTCYLPEDISVVARYVKRFKVASFEANDQEFIDAHPRDAHLLVSLGMGQSPYRVRWPARVGFLHCVSAYPTPADQMNLARLRDRSGVPYAGLSDHSRHPWTGALAVAAGARVIEFHCRLDTTDPRNADFAVARTPQEALEYVAHIREAEARMGDGVAVVQEAERPMLRYRSVGAR